MKAAHIWALALAGTGWLAASCLGDVDPRKPHQLETPAGFGDYGWGAVVATHDGAKPFEMKCTACHTIGGGGKLGPDLKGVTERRTDDWLTRWLRDPPAMMASDPDAKALAAEWKHVSPMPNFGLPEPEIALLIDYMRWRSEQPDEAPDEAPAASIALTVVDGALPSDDAGWDEVPSSAVPLSPQNITMPAVERAELDQLTVQAVANGEEIAFRLSWADATRDDQVDTGRFTDAVAIQLPLVASAPSTMGSAEAPVQILYWKALWQRDQDEHFQDVQDLYPNYWTDLYWFAKGSFPYPIPEAFSDPRSHAWFPAKQAGNPGAQFAREAPVEELIAAGFGSLTHQPRSATTGRGTHADGRWTVVLRRPLRTDDPSDAQLATDRPMKVAFAAWQGSAQQAGGRKQWADWTPLGTKAALSRPPALHVARVTGELSAEAVDAGVWSAAEPLEVALQPQNVAMPKSDELVVSKVSVQAVTDGERLGLKLSWADPSADTQVDVSRFADAVAVQFPLAKDASPMMGTKDGPVHVLLWKALWQKDQDEGFQDVQDVHPNYWTDLYWFAKGKFPYPIPEAFDDPRSHAWFPAKQAGNPGSQFTREAPVQELTAAGFGTLTNQPEVRTRALGRWADGRWTVVLVRPLATEDPNDYQIPADAPGQLALAVWEGSKQQAGGRKSWSQWVPFELEAPQ